MAKKILGILISLVYFNISIPNILICTSRIKSVFASFGVFVYCTYF